jgi:hypothetical protein
MFVLIVFANLLPLVLTYSLIPHILILYEYDTISYIIYDIVPLLPPPGGLLLLYSIYDILVQYDILVLMSCVRACLLPEWCIKLLPFIVDLYDNDGAV